MPHMLGFPLGRSLLRFLLSLTGRDYTFRETQEKFQLAFRQVLDCLLYILGTLSISVRSAAAA